MTLLAVSGGIIKNFFPRKNVKRTRLYLFCRFMMAQCNDFRCVFLFEFAEDPFTEAKRGSFFKKSSSEWNTCTPSASSTVICAWFEFCNIRLSLENRVDSYWNPFHTDGGVFQSDEGVFQSDEGVLHSDEGVFSNFDSHRLEWLCTWSTRV